jgi:hypothetical protein
MNIWKISTITLTVGMAILAGKDAFTSARAATPASTGPTSVAWDWGQEQPHMERALADLQGARHSLEAAAEHKGGWRALALRHTDEAIAETRRGIEYGKGHPHE